MLSVHKVNMGFARKLKLDLEQWGFRVCLTVSTDVDHVDDKRRQEEILDESFCVVLCISESYRESVRCRNEAERALSLGKSLVAIVVAPFRQLVWYKSDWLDSLLQEVHCYHYHHHHHEVSLELFDLRRLVTRLMNMVVNGLPSNVRSNHEQVTITTMKLAAKKRRCLTVSEWTEEQVREWFEAVGLNMELLTSVAHFNGEILVGLYEMRCVAPHFFKKALTHFANYDDKHLGMLSYQMQKLLNTK